MDKDVTTKHVNTFGSDFQKACVSNVFSNKRRDRNSFTFRLQKRPLFFKKSKDHRYDAIKSPFRLNKSNEGVLYPCSYIQSLMDLETVVEFKSTCILSFLNRF